MHILMFIPRAAIQKVFLQGKNPVSFLLFLHNPIDLCLFLMMLFRKMKGLRIYPN